MSKSTSASSIILEHHQKTLMASLQEWKGQNRVPPVLLLTGLSGIGKKEIAYFLAQWIRCERKGMRGATLKSLDSDLLPCGECRPCQQDLSQGSIDFIEIDANSEEEGGSKTLKIDQFRALKASIGFSGYESPYQIVIIPSAERMTIQAANSILKLLEEPPVGWFFILTTPDPTLLLSTLTSRCQILRLKPFSTEEILSFLQASGIDSEKIQICAELAQGSPSRALHFSEEKIWEFRKMLFRFLKDPQSELSTLIDLSTQDVLQFDVLLDLLEQLTAELIRWTLAPTLSPPQEYPWASMDGKSALDFHSANVVQRQGSPSSARLFWIERALRIAEARQQSLAPLNRKILVQEILFPWMEAY